MNTGFSTVFKFVVFLLSLYFAVTGLFSSSREPTFDEGEESIVQPKTRNVILMVIDALRADMVSSPKFAGYWPNLERLTTNGIVDCSSASLASPTVTSPRIKAIATGRLPEFIDAIYNTNVRGVTQDSWPLRMARSGRRLELYGDNTWLQLFPDAFGRSDGTTSFFVNDFNEVDSNVTLHLDHRVPAVDQWDLIILHYLGLDHIGHVQGPYGSSMPAKLREMDDVVGRIVSHLEASSRSDWLFIITGDHGMSNQGSHGGSSFFEISTTLLMISPKFARISSGPKNCMANPEDVFPDWQDQTDIATTLGLVTGVGIPVGSLGMPSKRFLEAFWPEPLERLNVLRILLHQLHRLASVDNFSSLVKNEVQSLKMLSTETASLLEVCSSNLTNTSTACNNLDAETDTLSQKTLRLMRSYQSRVVLTALNFNHRIVGGAIVAMWLIALSFLLPPIWRMLTQKDLLTLKLKRGETYTVMLRFLTALSLFAVLLHLPTLFSSSLVEEEHQTWYFVNCSLLCLLAFVMTVADHASDGVRLRTERILSVALILTVDRFLLRYLNRTGDKWIHLPVISDWLIADGSRLWTVQVASWLFLIVIVRGLLAMPAPRFRLRHLWSVASLSLVAASQLFYRGMHPTPNLIVDQQHDNHWSLSVWPARIAYICIAVDLFIVLRFSADLAKWTNALNAQADHSLDESPVIASGMRPIVSPVHAFGFVMALLGRPAGVLVWATVLLKESLLTTAFHSELVASSRCSATAHTRMKYAIILLYWVEGWTTFFQSGNSNKFSTIDLTAGYVGISFHSNWLSLVLQVVHTFGGPIFWQLALFHRFFARTHHRVDAYNKAKATFISMVLGLLTTATTVSATACLLLHNHLFIWSVFAPKLLYMTVLNFVFLPLLAFMLFV